jgi:transposase
LTGIVRIADITAGVILGEVGDIARFAAADPFASYTGIAPRGASRRGHPATAVPGQNRRLNAALHTAALSSNHDPRGKAYYGRKINAGKGSNGSLRCVKRRLPDVVFRTWSMTRQ